MKIGVIIGVVFVVSILICALALSFVNYTTSTNALNASVLSGLDAVVESRANHIDTYLSDNIEELGLIITRTQLLLDINNFNASGSESTRGAIVKKLNDSKNALEEIDRICFIGLDGSVKASSDESFIGVDNSAKDFFIKGKEKSGVYFVTEKGERKLFFSGPFVLDGKVMGVGLMAIDGDEFNDIVLDNVGLGQTGEVLIAMNGKDGQRIYLADRKYESEAIDQSKASSEIALPMKTALAGTVVSLPSAIDYRDKKVIASTQFISDYNIGVVAKIDYSEAIEKNSNMLFVTTIEYLFLFLIIFLIISFYVSRLISRPITNLSHNVEEITKGNLEVQLSKSSIEEIQTLTDSLNRVLASMKLAILRMGLSKQEFGIGEALKARRDAEDKYKLIYESSNEAMMVLEPPMWKFTSANPATIKLFKAKNEEEFISKGPGEVSPEKQPNGKKSADEAKKMIETALKIGSASFDWVHKKISGENFQAQVLLSRFESGGKTVLQATVRDISVEKKLDLEIQRQKNFLDDVINSIPDPIFVKNEKHTWILVNNSFCKFIGHKREELIGKSDYDFFPKKQADVFWEKDELVFKKGAENINEEKFTDAKGKEHTIITKKKLYYEKDGSKVLVGLIRDVTDNVKVSAKK